MTLKSNFNNQDTRTYYFLAGDDEDISETVKQAREESGIKSGEKVEEQKREEKPWRKNMSGAPSSKG